MSLFTSTPRERRMAWRAGLFVTAGLVLAGIVVFFIGQQTQLLRSHAELTGKRASQPRAS